MYDRFVRSAQIDANNWRDPQHDLEAIRRADADERKQIELFLVTRGVRHYIDAEALALLDTPRAREVLREAYRSGSTEIRAAVAWLPPELIAQDERLAELVRRIDEADAYEGLSLTLAQIETTRPPEVIEAMLRRIATDPGVAAVHYAAMLFYLKGIAAEAFDWDHRPFFLRFNPGNEADRRRALIELCERIGEDPARFVSLLPPA